MSPLRNRSWALALAAVLALAGPAGAQMRGEERKLVAQFDKDGDKRLNRYERAAARASLVDQSEFGFGRRWGRGGMVSPGKPGMKLTPDKVQAVPANKGFYDSAVLRTVFLQFENPQWEDELQAFYNTDVDIPATMIVDGHTFRDVGVHFRGQSSFGMVPAGSKRSLNIETDFVNKKQAYLGYNSLNFLNAMNDPTFVRTVLYSEIARAYIPALKVNLIRTVINDEDWGVYLNVQQYNRDFLRENFPGKDSGTRFHIRGRPWGNGGLDYMGEDVASYKAIYQIKSKDDPKAWARLIELARVMDKTPPAKLEAALAPLLDIDGALKFLALELVLCNSDGYWARASDYNLYLDPDGRFHVIAHDFNEALYGEELLDPLIGLDDETKPLRSKLLAVPALKQRYLRYVKDIATNWLDWNRVGPIAMRQQALVADEVAVDTRKLYSTAAFRDSLSDLRTWMDARRSYLLQ